jgi:hypothetical protein
MMFSFFKSLCVVACSAWLVPHAFAQTTPTPDLGVETATELAAIAAQRLVIEADKKIVLDQFQIESKACWQVFAVNDCLANARRLKYQQLAPLDQREVVLNAKHRELKERERQQRLLDKAPPKASS